MQSRHRFTDVANKSTDTKQERRGFRTDWEIGIDIHYDV